MSQPPKARCAVAACAVDERTPASPSMACMTTTKLDLTGLKCPLPALNAQGAEASQPGSSLEVHCTDPLSVIDIPNLIRETGDKVEIAERNESRIVFLIEKANGLIEKDWIVACAPVTAPVDILPFSYRHLSRLLSQSRFSAGLRRSSRVPVAGHTRSGAGKLSDPSRYRLSGISCRVGGWHSGCAY